MMRSLRLSLTIFIGVSMAMPPPGLFAATLAKSSPGKVQKANRTQAKKKIAADPGDLWARIRGGMRIPQPVATSNLPGLMDKNPPSNLVEMPSDTLKTDAESSSNPINTSEKPDNLPESNLKPRPKKALPATNRYTELGLRRGLGTQSPTAKIIDCSLSKSTGLPRRNATRNIAEIAQINAQIKAGMEARSQTRKHTVILLSGGQSNTNAALAKQQTPSPAAGREQAPESKTARSGNPCDTHPARANGVYAGDRSSDVGSFSSATGIKTRQTAIDERIHKHILGYAQNPGFLRSVSERAQPYLYHIVENLSQQRMPLELALLPIVESAYRPTAQSPKKAAGLWQFIPMTGKDFNLEQSSVYDERLSIPESTRAAIRFLSGLKEHFKGDWLLALAAYNAGQGTIDNAISLNQAADLPTDFWSLRLPEETQNYVPRLLALAKIFSQPKAYGIQLPPIKNAPYFVEVRIGREFDVNYLTQKQLDNVAQLAGLSTEQFSSLNPAYLNGRLPKQDTFTFLMPEQNAKLLKDRLFNIEKFVSAPATLRKLPFNGGMLQVESGHPLDFPGSTLSLLSDLVANKSPRLHIPLLSLNIDTQTPYHAGMPTGLPQI